MLLDQESHRSFAETLPPEERYYYYELVGYISKLPKDDEMRCFVDTLALYARTALRAATLAAERIEAANHQLSARLMGVVNRLEKLEKVLSPQPETFEAACMQYSSGQNTAAEARELLESIRDELTPFLKTVPVRGPHIQADEEKLLKKAVGQIDVLSKEFRRFVMGPLREMRSLDDRIAGIALQKPSPPNRPPPSAWERCWPVLAGMAICFLAMGLAYWVGLRAGGH